MKNEIISVHVGECGIRLGDKFLQLLAYDHGITPTGTYWESNPSQTSKIDVFFNETKNQAKARLYCVDLDKKAKNFIENSKHKLLYEPKNIILGEENYGTESNYAKGYYNQKSKELLDNLTQTICDEADLTENLQGLQIIHSLGGGTGSGFGSLLLEDFADTYPKHIISTFSVIPSPRNSNLLLEPYNFVLALPALKEYTNYNFCLDNESLCNILIRDCKNFKPKITDINHIVAHAINGITTTLGLPSVTNGTLRAFYNNMVPRKDLHLLLPSIAPLVSTERVPSVLPTESTLSFEIFRSRNCLAEVDLMCGKTLVMAAIFRGPMNLVDINKFMTSAKKQYSQNFSNWMSNSVDCSLSVISNNELPKSVTAVVNSSAVREMFNRIEERFIYNIKRRYLLHYYTDQGMDEEEFKIAHNLMVDWMENYTNFANNIALKNVTDFCEKKKVVNDLKAKKT